MAKNVQNQSKKLQYESRKKQIEKIEEEQKARKDFAKSPNSPTLGIDPRINDQNINPVSYPKPLLQQLLIYLLRILGYLIIPTVTLDTLSFFFNRSNDLQLIALFSTFVIFFVFGIFVVGFYLSQLFQFFGNLKSGRARFTVSGSFFFIFITLTVLVFGIGVLVSPFGIYFTGKDFFVETQKICGTYLGPTGRQVNIGTSDIVYYKPEYKFLINNAEKIIVELKLDYKKVPINSNICFDYKPNSKIMNNAPLTKKLKLSLLKL